MSNSDQATRRSGARDKTAGSSHGRYVAGGARGRGIAYALDQFMTWFGLSVEDTGRITQLDPSAVWSIANRGEFTLEHVTKLLWYIQKRQVVPPDEYQGWRKTLYVEAFLSSMSQIGPKKRWSIWDRQVMRGLHCAVLRAYDAFAESPVGIQGSFDFFAKSWEEEWRWVRVPQGYRVTRVDQNRYELLSTLPLALEIGRIRDLGPGLRVESKGWGTGAYRIYRVSTEPLGDPTEFEPALVHIPAGEFQMGTAGGSTPGSERSEKVYLDEYWIGRYPVTVAQFAYFVEHYGYFTQEEEQHGCDGKTWRIMAVYFCKKGAA